jgi:hypothetical protein
MSGDIASRAYGAREPSENACLCSGWKQLGILLNAETQKNVFPAAETIRRGGR